MSPVGWYVLLSSCSLVGRVLCEKTDEEFKFDKITLEEGENEDKRPHFELNLMSMLKAFWRYSMANVDGYVFLGLAFITSTVAMITIFTTIGHWIKMAIVDKKEYCLFMEWVYLKSEQHPIEFAEELTELILKYPELTGHTMYGKLMSQGVFMPVPSESGSEGSDVVKQMRKEMLTKRAKEEEA